MDPATKHAQASISGAAPAVPEARLSPFGERLRQTVNSAACCLGLAYGSELGLFRVLCRFESPASSEAIAAEAKLSERWVRGQCIQHVGLYSDVWL